MKHNWTKEELIEYFRLCGASDEDLKKIEKLIGSKEENITHARSYDNRFNEERHGMIINTIDPLKPVGSLKINESFTILIYNKMPNMFHRLMARILLGWKYRRVSE